ncbi:coiled-coil domain-containing protein 138-like [Meleagris gallopavo]|uniref:coiled-coil domain-containing protein 138-like n=1 Tax=Meleagris gallopavo TaxID=9103 RepID=UPI000938CCED|nr:coiled-coil domain-containing protein 138-like [Meleagris gallopavo]
MAEMYKDTCEVAQQTTPLMQEEVRAASKGDKLPPNSEVYGLLTVLMDWISDEHLSKVKRQEERENGQKPQSSGRTYIQERCLKVRGREFALVHAFSDSRIY